MHLNEPRIGPYIPVKTLGEGTTGKVKLAYHSETGENVAIKVISKSAFEKKANLEMKVQREIALMRLTNHPNIMKLLDVFDSPRHLYIILEYAQQGELFDFLISRKSLPESEALDIFRQIILGIEYLHEFGICHRDLKPENILLDSCNRIKIADFGFARWGRKNLVTTSCGSPHYAAPEVISGGSYDGRKADIWSCGVILYALIAGFLPFDDPSIRALLQKVKRGNYTMPNFSPDVQDLVHRMLITDPNLRISIPQIKEHPCFKNSIPNNYILPHPIPFPTNLEIIDINSLQNDIIQTLIRIGFNDEQEIFNELSSTENTMAKVFVRMLTSQSDFEQLPWEKSYSSQHSNLFLNNEEQDIYMEQIGSLHVDSLNKYSLIQSESVSISGLSLAKRPDWVIEESFHSGIQAEFKHSTNLITLWELMYSLQCIFFQFDLQWFHPDPLTFIIRKESDEIYMTIEVIFRNKDNLDINAKLFKGEYTWFTTFCETFKSTF